MGSESRSKPEANFYAVVVSTQRKTFGSPRPRASRYGRRLLQGLLPNGVGSGKVFIERLEFKFPDDVFDGDALQIGI